MGVQRYFKSILHAKLGTLLFILGLLSGLLLPAAFDAQPFSESTFISEVFAHDGSAIEELASPGDYVSEDAIHVYTDRVILDVSNPQWAKFTDTNSMDPILDEGTNAIEIVPQSPSDLQVGDIISYRSTTLDAVIIHRIISIGLDADGTYYTLKGDNNPGPDPERVRFSQIQRKVIAIIY